MKDVSNGRYLNFIKINTGNRNVRLKNINLVIENINPNRINNLYQLSIYNDYMGSPRGVIYRTRGLPIRSGQTWHTVDLSNANIVLQANKTYWIAYTTNTTNPNENVLVYNLNQDNQLVSAKSIRTFGFYNLPTYPRVNLSNKNYSLYVTYEVV